MNKNLISTLLFLSLPVLCLFYYLVAQEQNIQTLIACRNQMIDQDPKKLMAKSLDQQVDQAKLDVQGKIPEWLDGTLLRVGPAKFETSRQLIRHIFDGFAMVYAFDFTCGKLTYSNRFLDTAFYKQAMETGKLMRGFASVDERNIFQRFCSFFSRIFFGGNNDPYDNANVNIAKIGNHYVSLTEAPLMVEFDNKTIATRGYFEFDDQLAGDVTTAHPLVDPNTGEMFNYLVEYGRTSYYHVYKVAQGSTSRVVLASIPVDNPSYMHSFSITKDYVILSQIPLTVNPLSLLLSSKAFIDNFVWEPEIGTIFTILNRHSGEIVGNFKGDAFFYYHHVNAYQKDSSIIVDLVAYDDDAGIRILSLDDMIETNLEQDLTQNLLRFSIDLTHKKVDCKKLSSTRIEMPTVNYKNYGTKEYRYAYGVSIGSSGRYGASLAKINVQTGSSIAWINEECTAGEPVFVANPNGKDEDDGILLSVVLDLNQKKSFLLILDAKTLNELARAYVPHHIPFGFHGNFFDH